MADDPELLAAFAAIEDGYEGFAPIHVERVTSGDDGHGSHWAMIVYTHDRFRDGAQRLGDATYVDRDDVDGWAMKVWDGLQDRSMVPDLLPDDPDEILWDHFALAAGWDIETGPPPPPPRGERIVDFAAVVAERLCELSSRPQRTSLTIEIITVGRTSRPGVDWMVVVYRSDGPDGDLRIGWGGTFTDTDKWTGELARFVDNLWCFTIVEPPGSDLPEENIRTSGISWWRGREAWTVKAGPPEIGLPASWTFVPEPRAFDPAADELDAEPEEQPSFPLWEGIAAWRLVPDGHRDLILSRFDATFGFREQPRRKGPRIVEPTPSRTFDLTAADPRGFADDDVHGHHRVTAVRAAINAETLRCILTALPDAYRMLVVDAGPHRGCVEFRPRTQAIDRARWLRYIYPHQHWSALLTLDLQHGVFGDAGQRTLCVIGQPLVDTLGRSLATWLPTLRVDGVPVSDG